MAAVDELKNLRSKGYSPKESFGKPDQNSGKPEEDESSTTRIIKLTDDEQKTFSGSKPGEDLTCEVHGSLEDDGHFHVMSVSPMNGASDYTEQGMAGQVAQRVMPNIVPSPS